MVPVIILGLGALILGGVGAGAEGGRRQYTARRIHKATQDRLEQAEYRQQAVVGSCEEAADRLGQRKALIMSRQICELHGALSRFRGLELPNAFAEEVVPGVDGLDFSALDTIDFRRWGAIASASIGLVKVTVSAGSSSAAVTGASTILAYGGATTAGGTALSTINGMALTNATVAWFGGGSIAAGGGGIAAGTMVLSGIAAAPAALVGGVALLHIGGKSLKQAQANEAEARTMIALADAENAKLSKMTRRANDYDALLAELQPQLERYSAGLRTIADRETDLSLLSDHETAWLRTALWLFELTIKLVNAELMHDGRVTPSSARLLDDGQRLLATLAA